MFDAIVRNGILVTVAALIVTVLGLLAALRIPVQMIPDLEVRTISMPHGGRLVVRTRNVELGEPEAAGLEGGRPGAWLVLSVEDSGGGIAPTALPHIFEPFFTTKGDEGTGLGLATSYGIVAQSAGFITVDSEMGVGTRFDVYLPRSHEAASEDLPAEEAEAKEEVECGGETILVVEDQEQVRTLVMRGLERFGYRPLGAENPEVALELLEAEGEGIDLMLTDIIMPGMNGAELVRRARHDRPDLPVIYMSGYPGSVVEECCLDIDRDPILSKPFSYVDLASRVREQLSSA